MGAITLTGRADSATLALQPGTLGPLRENMANRSKTGGKESSATASTASRKARHGISFVSRMLMPSERASLRQDLKNTIEIAKAVKV